MVAMATDWSILAADADCWDYHACIDATEPT